MNTCTRRGGEWGGCGPAGAGRQRKEAIKQQHNARKEAHAAAGAGGLASSNVCRHGVSCSCKANAITAAVCLRARVDRGAERGPGGALVRVWAEGGSGRTHPCKQQ